MHGHVRRRLIAVLCVLGGVLALACWLVAVLSPVPFAWAVTGGVAVVAVQYLVAPWVIAWLVPATELVRTADGYRSDEPVAAIVARQCRAGGLPLVRLGIVEDGEPNAFTFGRSRRDSRVWISRGLLDRLDEREVEAVVAHELGHVAHRDVAVMTAASLIPAVLYFATAGGRAADRPGGNDLNRLLAFAAYLAAQLALLGFARAREFGADHASCRATGDGDALCSALVRIAYGIDEVGRERAARIAALRADDENRQARRLARRAARIRSTGALGIAGPGGLPAAGLLGPGVPPERIAAAMRWENTSPWARWGELFATHPLVVHRIAALERSGLPGAPTRWGAVRAAAAARPGERTAARGRFLVELPLHLGGWACLVAALTVAQHHLDVGGPRTVAVLVAAAGVLLVVRAALRSPLGAPEPVDEAASLLERLDAGPVGAVPVSLRGRIVGRGGYVASPDFVLADDSGIVPIVYLQPFPGARTFFGLTGADAFVDQEVLVTGWFLRAPGPYVELRSITGASGHTARSWQFVARYALSLAVLLVGAVLLALNL
ncbi:M48 family metalloprotease [Frankia sp. AvcI1]|uniref:M48 family metalloprotease n=1 Tax=Frankia sp. AvcI1 TaxID=573496 RepID=UPI000A8D34FB|nr:M48 family metalloprotease [Frankia sp. AvcI1]